MLSGIAAVAAKIKGKSEVFNCDGDKWNQILAKTQRTKLVNYKIPILFVITKIPFNPYNSEIYKKKKHVFDRTRNAIESTIKEIFIKENKENESKIFIKENTRFY